MHTSQSWYLNTYILYLFEKLAVFKAEQTENQSNDAETLFLVLLKSPLFFAETFYFNKLSVLLSGVVFGRKKYFSQVCLSSVERFTVLLFYSFAIKYDKRKAEGTIVTYKFCFHIDLRMKNHRFM